MSGPSNSSSSSVTSSSLSPSASSTCTTPEPNYETKPAPTPALTIPQHDDPKDYTIPSLAWQYTGIASALEHLNCTASAVIEEFKSLASELASRAAGPHNTPRIPPQPEKGKATMEYIRAIARYKMRVNPRASFAAWKDDAETMERVLERYRELARTALASADANVGCDYPEVEGDTSLARGRKRPLEDVEITPSIQNATAPRKKQKRSRPDRSDAQAVPRRSSRKSVAPRRFGASD
ncbi:unnamed protein product [Peniophora sp. CBMAI 1063]|nr:unnamed protein product [Peniophora sp. CBMAI 1063]